MLCYVPALLSGIEFQVKKGLYDKKYLWQGFDGSWFTDRAIYQHDHVLTSYYYSGKITDYRKTLGINETKTLWADSGGFSLATKGAKIDPRNVLRWQELNSNIAFTLDYPPVAVSGGNQTSSGSFNYISLKMLTEHAIKTARNNEIFAAERTNPNLLIYNVIHGNRLSYMEEWWKYNGHFSFEGYATGTKPTGDALYQAFNIAFLHSKGVRSRIHLLGVSGIRVLPALAYLSQYVECISFDSTSYGRGALNKTYFLPDKINEHISFGVKDYILGSLKELPCNCPVCQKINSPDELAAEGTWSGMLCALHNLYLIKEWTAKLNESLGDQDKFTKLTINMTAEPFESSMTAKAIDFFNYYLKYGIEEACSRYFPNKANTEHTRKKIF
jgi:tRNA-guanine family transglycosylase